MSKTLQLYTEIYGEMKMNDLEKFEKMLRDVDHTCDGFVRAVIRYVKSPGKEHRQNDIEEYIMNNPAADSSDVLQLIMEDKEYQLSVIKRLQAAADEDLVKAIYYSLS